ncbi:unnamed protein product [Caenorhabditis auriculariae]|uniref:Uncharacterized protein n=1 Tax=Caenorhabditis auriculariae TaxID=2777116 RepID=A0A8S1HQ68_9PELO|nr:unnamed protein product [Caenorhabditis auriculariae]
MPSTTLLKRDWEKDHVYLVQFPRPGLVPTPSPFALKLETWLRMSDIPYTNINNNFTKMSSRGQIPFIELNGRQFPDSNMIIEQLTKEFHKEHLDYLQPQERATARAFHALIESHLTWISLYSRSQDNAWLATDQGYGQQITGVKGFFFKNVLLGQMRKKLTNACTIQGIARLSHEEIIDWAKKDLEAVSAQLGGQQYLMGDRVTTLDATAFGHLVQLLYTPQFTEEIKAFITTTTPNIVSYVERIKQQYWPDWDEATKNRSLDTKWKL